MSPPLWSSSAHYNTICHSFLHNIFDTLNVLAFPNESASPFFLLTLYLKRKSLMFTPELSLLFTLAASLRLHTSPPSSNSQTSLNRLTLIFPLLLLSVLSSHLMLLNRKLAHKSKKEFSQVCPPLQSFSLPSAGKANSCVIPHWKKYTTGFTVLPHSSLTKHRKYTSLVSLCRSS